MVAVILVENEVEKVEFNAIGETVDLAAEVVEVVSSLAEVEKLLVVVIWQYDGQI